MCMHMCMYQIALCRYSPTRVQMLQRSSQVGEFYRMMPPAVWNRNKLLPAQYLVRSPSPPPLSHPRHTSCTAALDGVAASASCSLSSTSVILNCCLASSAYFERERSLFKGGSRGSSRKGAVVSCP